MSEHWYKTVAADVPLMQGDLVFDCPLLSWKSDPLTAGEEDEARGLEDSFDCIAQDVVVMTQACDLAQEKVRAITLCPHYSLEEWEEDWRAGMAAKGQARTTRAWRTYCTDIKNGFLWNLSMLNGANLEGLQLGHRIVDFHEVFTIPREFLESLLRRRGADRLRLLPPYREHLSQAFARFYMRVGLPVDIPVVW